MLTENSYKRKSVVKEEGIDKLKLSVLIFFFIAHYFEIVCIILMVMNVCINPNLISLFFPLSALLYGIIENSI